MNFLKKYSANVKKRKSVLTTLLSYAILKTERGLVKTNGKGKMKKIILYLSILTTIMSANTNFNLSVKRKEYANLVPTETKAVKKRQKEQNNVSFIDNYVEQSLMSDEERQKYEDLVNKGLAPNIQNGNNDIYYYSSSTASENTYSDNEPSDGKPSGATKIGISGTIQAKLDIKSGWDQFWNSIGERDEDYYRFTLKEQVKMSFTYSGPDNYYMRILRYEGSKQSFICNSSGSFEIELIPATYYIHVYANSKEDIKKDQIYKIAYSGIRISNLNNLYLNDIVKDNYGMAVWENEIWPQNSTRWKDKTTKLRQKLTPRRGAVSDTGYVDPLFYEDQDQTVLSNEIYLDSIVYVWDKELIAEFEEKVQEIVEAMKQAIVEKKITEFKAQMLKSALGEFAGGAFEIIGIKDNANLTTIISIALSGKNLLGDLLLAFFGKVNTKEAIDEFESAYYMGALAEACHSKIRYNDVLRIPMYYFIKGKHDVVGNSTLKSTTWYRESSAYPFKGSLDLSMFDFDEQYIAPIQIEKKTGKSYHGKITAFKKTGDFDSYINGDGGGDEMSNHVIHDYSLIEQKDSTYHVISCHCGAQKLMRHSYFYDGLNCKCEYCGYVTSTKETIIKQSDYKFDSYYNLYPTTEVISNDSNDSFTIKKLRTGTIEEKYLVMSAKSNDSDTAYMEYYLDADAVEFTYQLGLWSDDESLIRNSSIKFEVKYEENWVTIREFSAKDMSVDKDALLTYTDTLEYGTDAFRFIVETNKVKNENNRGRVVIGDITLRQVKE